MNCLKRKTTSAAAAADLSAVTCCCTDPNVWALYGTECALPEIDVKWAQTVRQKAWAGFRIETVTQVSWTRFISISDIQIQIHTRNLEIRLNSGGIQ